MDKANQIIANTKNARLTAPITIPAIARLRPVGCGAFFICDSATMPRITAINPGIGTAHIKPTITLKRPTTHEAMAKPGGGGFTFGRGGGGGASHWFVNGARSSGAIQPLPGGGSGGSHCVVCSEGSSNFGSRMRGSQFGSAAGVRSSRSRLPSFVQKVSQASKYCLLHCGQYFITAN